MKSNTIIIGAGAAGLMAAGFATDNGNNVILLERNQKVARKVMITGKGRCNLTNNCDIDQFISNVPVNGRFLYSAVTKFSPKDTMEFFENQGLKLKTERGRRVFPQSDKAMDVVDTLYNFVKKSGVKIINTRAQKLIIEENIIKGIIDENNKEYLADKVIICTGGLSYPGTGSTGDGYKMAQQAGHTIIKPKPSLVPLVCKGNDCKDMQGLSLKNISIKIIDNHKKKEIYHDFGEMLFTHFGVSGPLILSASSHMRQMSPSRYTILINFKPALTDEQLNNRLLREFEKSPNSALHNVMGALLPKSAVMPVIRKAKLTGNEKINQITKEMRYVLINVLTNFPVIVEGFRPIEEAIITSGGINVKEIDPKTMQSKLVSGLYFAGEIIDVDAYTGGYNLQIAFSTGVLAGAGDTPRQSG